MTIFRVAVVSPFSSSHLAKVQVAYHVGIVGDSVFEHVLQFQHERGRLIFDSQPHLSTVYWGGLRGACRSIFYGVRCKGMICDENAASGSPR